jgi:hypothetical protein
MSHYKRGRGLGDLGGNTYDQTISSGLITRTRDSIHYDTNILVTTSVDSGVTTAGAHGRYARFRDTRLMPLLGSTGDYTVALVRGTVTTNDIPLFCPKPSKLITENGQQFWEVSAEPGLAYTWTGPVYTTDTTSCVLPVVDQTFASWPTSGCIPFYTATTVPATGFGARKFGFLDCSTVGSSNDTRATIVASRLTTLFSVATLSTVTVGTSGTGSAAATQYYSFVNSSTTETIYLDFTLPSSYQQLNGLSGTRPTKKGILQACKLLGFVPNTIFAIPPGSVTVYAPRAYQLGFRTTMNLYSYKTVRWVPEDLANLTIPTEQDVKMGTGVASPSYFDCYSYQHFLNECINPTFQRVIYDEFDNSGSTVLSEQCLQRQLQTACVANCNTAIWSTNTSYAVGNSVTYNGRAYYAQRANTSVNPTSSTTVWMDIGTSILSSWVPGQTYYAGDVITYILPGSAFSLTPNIYTAVVTTTSLPTTAGQWTYDSTGLITAATNITPNIPAVATAAPYITFNPSTQLFVLNLDSYGFGGTSSTNVDDGYGGFVDNSSDPQSALQQESNATLNDQARDSWGLTGTAPVTTLPYTIARHPFKAYDEKLSVEVDDYFHQLFGNWPALRLIYTDPGTQVTTSYVRYIPQANAAGLAVSQPLPYATPTVAATSYLPYGRVAGNTPYVYTFPQDYPSVGLLWNPVDTLVVVTGEIPMLNDEVSPTFFLGDVYIDRGSSNGDSLKILGEYVVKAINQVGQEYRNEIVFEPQAIVRCSLQSGTVFKTFDYQIMMRMKNSNALRPLTISNGGSVFMRFQFEIKAGI